MTVVTLPGFADPVGSAQSTFRLVLTALSEPCRILSLDGDLPAAPGLGPAATAIGLSLLDGDTPLWCDGAAAAAAAYLRFHTGVPIVGSPRLAAFALIGAAATVPRLDAFDGGTDEYPDRSATLVIEVPALDEGQGPVFRGPGIPDRRSLAVAGLPEGFIAARRAASAGFPRGVDILFTCGARLAGLPRSTRIEG